MWKKSGSENNWQNLFRLPDKNKLLILLLIGILLVVIALPTSDKTESPGSGESEGNTGEPALLTEYEEYRRGLENKMEQALEKVEGVGKVNVMITLKSTGEKVVEKDAQTEDRSVEEEDSSGGSRLTKEESATNTSVYEQRADGGQSPYVSKEMTPEVEGIIVIAQGGDDPVIIRDITEAAQALFGIEAHKIKIMKRDDS